MADRHVLDASAVLCLLDDAPGAAEIAAALDTASVSSVTVALVAAELTRRGADPQEVATILRELHLNVVPFGFDQAIDAGTFGAKVSNKATSIEHWAWSTLASRTGATGLSGEQVGRSSDRSLNTKHVGEAGDDPASPPSVAGQSSGT